MNQIGSRKPDAVLLSVGWGALWGIALGAWGVAPVVVESHHLRPNGPGEWTLLIAALTVIFVAIGAVVAFFGGFAVAIVANLAKGSFQDQTWAYGFSIGFVVAGGYAFEGVLIHWGSFRSLDGLRPYRWHALAAGVACLIASAIFTSLYRRILRSQRRPAPAILAWCLCAAAVSGMFALIVQSRDLIAAPHVGALQRFTAPGEDVPLLFIGLDGATWRVLEPAMANGHAPTVRRLMEQGTHGTVEALWPPHWSGAAWAAILTGLPREVTGVYEDLAAAAPGLPLFQVPIESTPRLNPMYAVRAAFRAGGLVRFTPPPRALLRGTPVWQLLHEAGVETAVVRWRFTYPTDGQAGIVVSDWVGKDQWEAMGVKRPDGEETVSPPALADQLLAPFRSATPSDPELFSRLLPGARPAKPVDMLGDPIEELELASDIDNRTFEVSETIVGANSRQPFLAVYIGGLDSVEHAFWQYRFPEDFPDDQPAPHDIERLGPVMDRYVQYLDERLNRLLALYATEPNVVIVSDHGQGPSTTSSKWRGWHTKDGMFVAAGPSVPHRAERIAVSYYDVLPTLLRLKGFEKPEALVGRSLIRAGAGWADRSRVEPRSAVLRAAK